MSTFAKKIIPAIIILLSAACPVQAEEAVSVRDLGKAMTAKYAGKTPAHWGERMPGITSHLAGAPAQDGSHTVALTLDACEGGTDMGIIALLRKHAVPATIFITNRWLRRNMAVAKDLANDPLFTLACHGARHKPASVNGRQAFGINGTRTIAALVDEVETNARAITAVAGKRPSWYRSGTAYYDDVAVAVIRELGLGVAGYTVSADAGATLPAKTVARLLMNAPDGAIVLLHLNHPESGTGKGMALAVPAMLERGVRFTRLE